MTCYIPYLLLYFLKKKVITATMTRNISRTTTTATIDLVEELGIDNVGGAAEIAKLGVVLISPCLDHRETISFIMEIKLNTYTFLRSKYV